MENIVVILANKNTNINKSIKISYYIQKIMLELITNLKHLNQAEQNGVCGMKPEWTSSIYFGSYRWTCFS